MIAFEITNYFNKTSKRKKNYVGIKREITKAYDML